MQCMLKCEYHYGLFLIVVVLTQTSALGSKATYFGGFFFIGCFQNYPQLLFSLGFYFNVYIFVC